MLIFLMSVDFIIIIFLPQIKFFVNINLLSSIENSFEGVNVPIHTSRAAVIALA